MDTEEVMQADSLTYLDVGTQTDMEGTKQKVTQTDPNLSKLEVKICLNRRIQQLPRIQTNSLT